MSADPVGQQKKNKKKIKNQNKFIFNKKDKQEEQRKDNKGYSNNLLFLIEEYANAIG